ncbi:COG4648 family protein [Neoroseomonas soli]|uniref:Ketosynthase n=1 Tax=Neoroseomonas soli TaxID=1081025 RepID=A0A9X9WY64_9PROT|nr:hypothetical protein [Neoroseomonas soli]MBR0672093.1 hypothetical protein [Neoroseomonas soli]
MRLPRLAPRLLVSLPLSGLCLAARAAGQDLAAAALAAAIIVAFLAPTARPAGIVACALAAGIATWLWVGGTGGARAVLAALPLAGNLTLAWHFGATLRPGQEALIVRYSRAEHGEIPAGLVRYARRLTALWTAYFLLFSAMNAATLAGFGPPAGPSAALNIGLAAAFFLGEHVVRGMVFPELGPVRPWRTLRAIWRADAVPHAR